MFLREKSEVGWEINNQCYLTLDCNMQPKIWNRDWHRHTSQTNKNMSRDTQWIVGASCKPLS